MVSMEVHLEFLQVMASALACAAVRASHQSDAAPSSLPEAYKTFSRSLHWVMSSFFPMTLSQSSASKGSTAWEESRRVMAHKIPVLVSSLWCMLLLMLVLLILLYLLHRSSESLQKLHLRCEELLHIGVGWRWWQLLTTLVSVVPGTWASVHHLVG